MRQLAFLESCGLLCIRRAHSSSLLFSFKKVNVYSLWWWMKQNSITQSLLSLTVSCSLACCVFTRPLQLKPRSPSFLLSLLGEADGLHELEPRHSNDSMRIVRGSQLLMTLTPIPTRPGSPLEKSKCRYKTDIFVQ